MSLMRPSLRFLAVLLPALGALAWAASEVVQRTGRSWFDRDVELRAELALRGALDEVAREWRQGRWHDVQGVLDAITRDERILGALACDPEPGHRGR